MLGAAQEAVLARDTDAASRPGPNQTVWQQYLGGLVMLVRPVSVLLALLIQLCPAVCLLHNDRQERSTQESLHF